MSKQEFFTESDSDMSYRDAMYVRGITIAKANRLLAEHVEACEQALRERDEAYRRIAILESQASQFASTLAETVRMRDALLAECKKALEYPAIKAALAEIAEVVRE